MALKVKNWHKFQHFKDRKPPWIKLYRDILDDIFFHELDGDSAKVLFMCWLIASEHDGILPPNKELAFRLRMNLKSMNSCICKLSHWLIQDDINVISDISSISERYQNDALETETETETETDIGNSLPRCPVDKIVDLYHQVLPELPKVIAVTEKRKASIKQRWNQIKPETEDDGLEGFKDYFTLVRSSDFLMGKKPATNGHKVFIANLEWLVNESNFVKVAERNYHERV